jgi:CHAT domain-containing protein/regulator of replication initiation timing
MRKTILICTFFFGLHILLFAQARNLTYQVNRQLYLGHYSEAQTMAENALATARVGTSEYAMAQVQMGTVHLTFARYKQADSILCIAMDWLDANTQLRDSNYLQTCVLLSTSSRELAQFKRAETVLKKAENLSTTLKGTPYEAALTKVLQEYIALDIELARWGDTRYHFKQLFDLYDRVYAKKDPRRAPGLIAQAQYHLNNTWEWKLAIEPLEQAERLLTPVSGSYPLEYSQFLKTKASLYIYGMSRYKEGEILLKKALDHTKNTLGEQHTAYIDMLRDAASFQERYTPNFRNSKTLFEAALTSVTNTFGEHYPTRAGILQDLADWESNMGFNNKATVLRRSALAISQQVYGADHPQTAHILLNVAKDLIDEGKYKLVEQLIDSAESVYNRYYSNAKWHPSRINILKKRNDVLSFNDKPKEKIAFLEEVAALSREIYGINSIHYSQEIMNLANLLSWQVDAPSQRRSDSLFQEVIKFYSNFYGQKSIHYSQILGLSAWVKEKTGDLNTALEYVQQEQRIIESAIGRNNLYYKSGMTHLGRLYFKQNPVDTTKIKKYLVEQRQFVHQLFGDTSAAYLDYLDLRQDLVEITEVNAVALKLEREKLALRRLLGGDNLFIFNINSLASQLIQVGEYTEAKQLIQEGIHLCETDYGIQSQQYSFSLWIAVGLYRALGQNDTTLIYLDRFERAIKEMGNPEDWLSYFYTAKALFYRDIGNYKAAEEWQQKQFHLPNIKPNSGDYNVMGLILGEQERFAEADSMYRISLQLAKLEHGDTTAVVNNRANIQNRLGHNDKAIDMLRSVLRDTEKKYGSDHIQIATFLKNMAGSLMDAHRYNEADSFFQRAGNIILIKQGSEHPDYASFLNSRGVFYGVTDRFELEKKDYLESIRIAEKKLGKSHPDYLLYKSNYANHLALMGQTKVADSLYQELLVAYEQYATGTIFHASILENYATLLRNTGQYDRAIQETEKALGILSSIYSGDSGQKINSLSILAIIYDDQKQYTLSLATYQQALSMLERLQLNNQGEYALILYRIAGIEQKMRMYKDSEAHYKTSLQIRERIFGAESSYVGFTQEYMARLYEETNQLLKAAEAARRAVAIAAKRYGIRHENYAYPLLLLGSILTRSGNIKEGEEALVSAQDILLERLRYTYSYLPPSRQTNLTDQFRLLVNRYPTLAIESQSPELAKLCYDNTIAVKGVALQNSRNLREIVGRDTTLKSDFDQYLKLQRDIAKWYEQPTQQPNRLVQLQSAAAEVEQRLSAHSFEYARYLQSTEVGWRDVQNALESDHLAIEFIRYNRSRATGLDTFAYAALLVCKGWDAPKIVQLCDETSVKAPFANGLEHKSDYVANLYPTASRSGQESGFALDLYDLLWKPIEPYLKGITKISWAGTGILNRINLQALSDGMLDEQGNTIYLLNRFHFTQLRSTRLLCENNRHIAYRNTALLYGDIDFGATSINGSNRGGQKPWKELPQTKFELKAGKEALSKRNFTVTTRTDSAATAISFLENCRKKPSPRVIAAATHAFFESDSLSRSGKSNPLLRSGLVFAGGQELNAQEIVQLDLSGTELVILSACDAGLGDLHDSEGVFGLQRAFLEAGAKYVIISLWEVDDKAGREFMESFYANWLGSDKQISIPEAFEAAQKDRCIKMGNDIYRWGMFTLIQ